jgi:hypothetical protein
MRTAILIALVAMGITMSGCEWFLSKHKASTTFKIEGKWKLDSSEQGSDSSQQTDWLALAIAANDANDTTAFIYNFSNDSLLTISSPVVSDTSYYKLNIIAKEFVLKADSVETRYAFIATSDSLFLLTSSDSTVVWFKKQQAQAEKDQ